MTHRLAATFHEMIDPIAIEDPSALVLGWWRRLENALAYYTIAYHGRRMHTAAKAIRVLASDARVDHGVIDRLNNLRVKRNDIAHGKVLNISPEEAKQFAVEAWDLGWIVGCTVPDELAISSGAALAT